MKHTLTDFSQLSKSMFKTAPKVDEVKPEPPKAKPHDDVEEVLAYFSSPAAGARAAQKAPACAPSADGADARTEALVRDVAARPLAGTSLRSCASLRSQLPSEAELLRRILRAQLRDSEAARSDAVAKCADAEREREKLADALAYPLKKRAALLKVAEGRAARKEIERLKGECGRLQGEARKAALAATCAADAKVEPTVAPAAERPTRISPEPRSGEPRSGRYEGCVLAPPAAIAETFPGEVREMVLSALSEARDAARQSTRERRAAILNAVLATNRPTGELDRTPRSRPYGRRLRRRGIFRAELKQAMKDCGYYTDPKSIERLGFKLVSGRTHWKLEYGNVRMPIAKTPSDYRANLNMATDLANRCF